MYPMVENREEYNKFLENNIMDDLFIHIIATDDREHPVVSSPSVVFVQNFRTEELYHFSINHQDSPQIVDITELGHDLSKMVGRKFVLDKKSFIQHLPIHSVLDINLALNLKSQKSIIISDFETKTHGFIKQKYYTYSLLNKVVPLMKHRQMVSSVFDKIKNVINNDIFQEKYFLKINSLIVETLAELEMNGIAVNGDEFKKHFDATIHKGVVYSQYNLHTSTGRPSNRFGGVNYAALNKDDGSRQSFVSRFNADGILMLIDYSAFHHRILCELTNFKLGIDVDFYKYLAKKCFNKEEVTDQDVVNAKDLSWKQIYGGVEEQYSNIEYFSNLNGFIESNWKRFKKDGFTTTPIFGRKITKAHVQDPNPYKVLNYILQATETEIAVPILNNVNQHLRSKRSKAILYTYDSILFDVHNEELEMMFKEVIPIMKSNGRFPIKCYTGKSYGDLKQISL